MQNDAAGAPVGQTGERPETTLEQDIGMLEFCIKVPRMLGHRGMAIDWSLAERILAHLRAPAAPVADAGRPGESLSALYADDFAHERQPEAGRQDTAAGPRTGEREAVLNDLRNFSAVRRACSGYVDGLQELLNRAIAALAASAPAAPVAPGERTKCKKAPHANLVGGYLHSEDDDTPYDVDGVLYCGRCHSAWPHAAPVADAGRQDTP